MGRTKGSTNKPKDINIDVEKEKLSEKLIKPKKKTGIEDKFWFGTVFIRGVGKVSGSVREDHYEKFIENFKRGQQESDLPEQDQQELDIDYWIRDVDELEEKKKREKKKKKEIK